MKLIRGLLRDASGTTAIEYGLLAVPISIAVITALGTIGAKLSTLMLSTMSNLN